MLQHIAAEPQPDSEDASSNLKTNGITMEMIC